MMSRTCEPRLAARINDSPRPRERRLNPVMRVTSETVADGIREQLFSIRDIPGMLFTPTEGSGPVRRS